MDGAIGSAVIIARAVAGGEFSGEQFLTLAVLVFRPAMDMRAAPALLPG
jgi:hypothetical protein